MSLQQDRHRTMQRGVGGGGAQGLTLPPRLVALLVLIAAAVEVGTAAGGEGGGIEQRNGGGSCASPTSCDVGLSNVFRDSAWSLQRASTFSGGLAASPDECCARCAATPGCLLFEYERSRGLCGVFSFFTGQLDVSTPAEPRPGVDAYVATNASWPSYAWRAEPFSIRGGVRAAGDCATLCRNTCNCRYWTHSAARDECMMASPGGGNLSPPLVADETGDLTAGILFDPAVELEQRSSTLDWSSATYSEPYPVQGATSTIYRPPQDESDPAGDRELRFLAINVAYTTYNWTDTQSLWLSGVETVQLDLSKVSREDIGNARPGYLDTPLVLDLPLDGSSAQGAANLSLEMPPGQDLDVPAGHLKAYSYDLLVVDVHVPLEITFQAVRCSTTGQPRSEGDDDYDDEPLDLVGTLAANMTVEQVLRRYGFCGDSSGLGEFSGDVTVAGMLKMQLPLAMKDIKPVKRGSSCPASLDICSKPAAQLPGMRWAYLPLSSATLPLPTPAQCCAACRSSPDCVFWDHDRTSGDCSFYDWQLSLTIFDDGDSADLGLLGSVSRSRLPLVAGGENATAGFLDSKQYTARRWSLDPDAEVAVPPGTNAAAWCVSRCNTLCGCTYWAASAAAGRCLVFKEKAQGGALLQGEGWTAGIKFGRSLEFSAPQIEVDSGAAEVGDESDDASGGGGPLILAYHNTGPSTAQVEQLRVPTTLEWEQHETLSYFYPLPADQAVQLPLSALGSGPAQGLGDLQNSSLGPLLLPMSRGNTTQQMYPLVGLPSGGLQVPPYSTRQLRVGRVRRTPLMLPVLLSFDVTRCKQETPSDVAGLQQIGEAASLSLLGQIAAVQAQPAARFDALMEQLLGMDDLLLRAGCCGVVSDWRVSGQLGVDAFVQVAGTARLQLPTSLEDASVLEQGMPDATGCAPQFESDLLGGDLYPGTCNPTGNWQQCCDECRTTPGCMAWSWASGDSLSAAAASASGSCMDHCSLKGAAVAGQRPMAAPGVVSGNVVSGADGCSPVLQGYGISSESDPIHSEFLPSLGRCCQLCGLQDGCKAFAFNWTGECKLFDGVDGGRPSPGVYSGMLLDTSDGSGSTNARRRSLQEGEESSSCVPSAAQVPVDGLLGLASLAAPAGLTWQELCCFNGLEDCRDVSEGQQLLIPCSGQAQADCDAAMAVQRAAVATTTGGCACRSRYTYTAPDGRPYHSSGSCLRGVEPPNGEGGEGGSSGADGANSPWCLVDEERCPEAFGTGDVRGALCSSSSNSGSGGDDVEGEEEEDGEQGEDGGSGGEEEVGGGGCDLLPGVSLLELGTDGQPLPGVGGSPGVAAASESDCCVLCQATPGCSAFTFTYAGGEGGSSGRTGACYLKRAGSISTTRSVSHATSGVVSRLSSEDGGGAGSGGRRRRLADFTGGACEVPGVYPLMKGENLTSLPESVTRGVDPGLLCCFNGAVSNCSVAAESATLLIPCEAQLKGAAGGGEGTCDAFAGERNVETITESTSWGIVAAVVVPVCVACLLAGLLFGWAFSRRYVRRHQERMKLRAAGLEQAHDLAVSATSSSSSSSSFSLSASSSAAAAGRNKPRGSGGGANGMGEGSKGSRGSGVGLRDTACRYQWDPSAVAVGGSGAVATVAVGGVLRAAAGRPVVAKVFADRARFERERAFYKANPAPGAVPEVYDVFTSTDKRVRCVLVEERGDYALTRWMSGAGRSRDMAQHRVAALRQVAEALQAMHAAGMVHGSLSPAHMMWFNEAHRWKLIGLGGWATAGEETPAPVRTGGGNSGGGGGGGGVLDIRYAAPEVARAVRAGTVFTARPASDMWSLGCLVWEACTGEPLFAPGMAEDDVIAALCGDAPLPFEKHKALWMTFEEDQARRVAQNLLRRAPAERWPAERALNHALLKSANTSLETVDAIRKARGRMQALYGRVRQLQATEAAVLRSNISGALLVSIALEEVVGEDGDLVGPLREEEEAMNPAVAEVVLPPSSGQGLGGANGGNGALPPSPTAVAAAVAGAASAAAVVVDPADPLAQGEQPGVGGLPLPVGHGPRGYTNLDSARNLDEAAAAGQRPRGDADLGVLGVLPEGVLPEGQFPSAKDLQVKEVLHDLYRRGALPTEDAPVTLLSIINQQQGNEDEPVFLLHSERRYIIRLQVRFGGSEQLQLPVDGAEHCLLMSDATDDEALLTVEPLKDQCSPHVWHGFAVWDTSGLPMGMQEVELAIGLCIKSTREVVQVRKRLEVQLHAPSAPFSLERAGSRAADLWADAPDWVKLAAFGASKLFSMS